MVVEDCGECRDTRAPRRGASQMHTVGKNIVLLFFLMSRRVFVTLPFFDQFMTTGDMLKYFGIVFWLAFFYRTALLEVSALLNDK
jgi:hypothetical protein